MNNENEIIIEQESLEKLMQEIEDIANKYDIDVP